MTDVVEALVNEVLTLHAEVAALRVLVGASLSGDPARYFELVVPNIDAATLPLVMSEKQRDTVRQRLEHTREMWASQQRAAYPGGWRGIRYWVERTALNVRRVFAGAR
jgi:hypothetical protein